jgi:hypothetical protein
MDLVDPDRHGINPRVRVRSTARHHACDCKNRDVTQQAEPPAIRFEATAVAIADRPILRLPQKASEQLPSRGQVAVQGTINGRPFQTVLEPDGNFGHWISLDRELQAAASLGVGDSAILELELQKDWPEPKVPNDLRAALAAAPPEIRDLWHEITPMARWEWVRWVNATANPDTRSRRVEVTISKTESGKRRPCCFNLSSCTDPSVSKSGKLIEPV